MTEDHAHTAGIPRDIATETSVTPLSPPGYELLDKIGHGGMGVVYRARDLALDRDVAVKLLSERCPADSPPAQRFLSEARITGQLQHPGIPAVHQVGTLADGRPFLAMKLIKGSTLEAILKHRSDPSAERGPAEGGLAIFEAVCQAVGYAHAHRVIHRDLKPANIMIGAFGEVQVMDWGLAKVLGEETPATEEALAAEMTRAWTQVSPTPETASYTQAGSLVGTPAFIPPEQAAGEIERVNERSDVFGLGALLTVILTGKAPYVGETFESVRVQALRGKLEDCFARLDGCGAEPELVALCKKCLAFEPADRPTDAGAVAAVVAELRAAADERARQAELETREALARAAELRRRRRILLMATGIVALVFLVGFAGVAWQWQQAERQKDIAQKAERGEAAQRAIAEGEADRATREADQSRRLLYASDMSLALHAWEAGTFGHARTALERHRPQAGQEDLRGFEWRYLWGLCQDGSRHTLRGHTAGVSAVAFAPDGQTLATRGDDHSVRLWDMASRRHVKLLGYRISSGYYCGSLAFAPDGKTLAIADDLATAVHLWDVAARCERATLQHRTGVIALAFSPDGKLLATGCHDDSVHLWDIATRREMCTLEGHTGGVIYVAFAPDGKTLASGSWDSTVRLWDVARRNEITTFRGHTGEVKCLAFSPDGETLASGGTDSSVRLWDTVSKQGLPTLRGPGVNLALAFSPDGKRFATGGSDGTVRVWDPANREVVTMLQGHSMGIVRALAYSHDGQTLISAGEDGTIKIWDVAGRRDPNILPGQQAGFSSVAFSPDGKTLAAADWQGIFRLWDMGSREQVAALPGDKPPGRCVTFAPDGRTLATGNGNTAQLWDTRPKAPLADFQHPGQVYSMAFSPDGRLVAVGGGSTALVWDRATRREVARLAGNWVEFSPDGTLLAAGLTNTVRLHDVATWHERAAFGGHTPYVRCLAFSPAGKTLATGDWQGTLRLWDVAEKRLLASRQVDVMVLQTLAFSPDGRRLVTCGGDGGVKFWDAALLRQLDRVPGPDGPDGRRARERLWAAASLGAFTGGHDGLIWSVAFSPDGNTLASGGQDTAVRLWHAPPLPASLPKPDEAAVVSPPTETLRATSLELFDAAQATLTLEEFVCRVDVTSADGTGWHARLSQMFDDLEEGVTYTVRFRAKADVPRPIQVYGHIVEPDWHGFGLNEVVPLTADWQTFERDFQAKDLAASNLIEFHVGERTGTVWIADITVTKATK
jgi:WD40 repeat protein/serine/threonine protein kinase